MREILNSIFYQNRTGCQWAYLPHDTEPKDTEGVRAKLKRLVNRQILTESQPDLFTLNPERT